MNRPRQKKHKTVRHFTELGSYLKAKRLEAGVTQAQISDELGYSSSQFISNFECGISTPPAKKLGVIVRLIKADKMKAIRLMFQGEEKRMLEQMQ